MKNLYLVPLGVSNTELARVLGVSRKAVSSIVNEKKSVTPEMALRLSRALPNTAPEFWLNLQKTYDLWQAAHNSSDWQAVQPVASGGSLIYPDLSEQRFAGSNALRESDETQNVERHEEGVQTGPPHD